MAAVDDDRRHQRPPPALRHRVPPSPAVSAPAPHAGLPLESVSTAGCWGTAGPPPTAVAARMNHRPWRLSMPLGVAIGKVDRPIKHYRRAWLIACKTAGVPHRIPRNFRRTAVRNLERTGGAAVGRHEDGRPQDRGDLPALRDRGREDAARDVAKLEALLQARRHAGGGPAENRQNYFVGAQQQRRSPYRPSAKSPRQRAAECAGMGPSRLEEGK